MLRVILSLTTVCLFGSCFCHAQESHGFALTSNSTSSCEIQNWMVFSAVYSPYSVHIIKSEASGRIIKINAVEGRILRAGNPIVEIDSQAIRDELGQLQKVFSSLRKSEKILLRDKELTMRKYERYLTLRKKGHVEEQAVENIEQEFHDSELALIENRKQQADVRRNMIDLMDRIKKCAPSFTRDFYVAENFKELFETVVPGEQVSRLMDVSRAKVHLILSPGCFSRIVKVLHPDKTISFQLITEDGGIYFRRGSLEKLKIDTDNSYLYSYGFDLIFQPVEDILWGQVVKVRLKLDQHRQPYGKEEPGARADY